jgi:hypothetical protein
MAIGLGALVLAGGIYGALQFQAEPNGVQAADGVPASAPELSASAVASTLPPSETEPRVAVPAVSIRTTDPAGDPAAEPGAEVLDVEPEATASAQASAVGGAAATPKSNKPRWRPPTTQPKESKDKPSDTKPDPFDDRF